MKNIKGFRPLFREQAAQNRGIIDSCVSGRVHYTVWAGLGHSPGEGVGQVTRINHIINHQLESELNEKR